MWLVDTNIAVFIVVWVIEFLSQRSTKPRWYSVWCGFKVAAFVLLVLAIGELIVATICKGGI